MNANYVIFHTLILHKGKIEHLEAVILQLYHNFLNKLC